MREEIESKASEEQTTAVQAKAASLSDCLPPHDTWRMSPAFYSILFNN